MSNERTRSLISFYEKSAIVEPKLVTDTQTEPVLMSFQRPDNDQSGSINPYDGFAVFDPNATDPRVVAQNNESIQTQPVQSLPPQPQPVQPQPTQPQPVQYTQPEPVQRQPIQPQPVVTPQHETTHEMAQPLPISSTPAPQVVKAPEPTQHNSTEAVNGNMSTPPMHPVKMVDGRTDNGEVVNPTVKMDPQTASTLPVSERKEAIYDHTNGKPEPKPVFKPVDHNEDIISSIASVPITMMRPPFKGSPALKEAGKSAGHYKTCMKN